MEVGQVVFSKCGRDKGRAFMVLSVEGEYVFLADGQLRPLSKPKKKKVKHIQPTHVIMGTAINHSAGKKPGHPEGVAFCEAKRAEGGLLTDADVKKWLSQYSNVSK